MGPSAPGEITVLRLEPEEKKPSHTERLAAMRLEGWGQGASASLGVGSGGEVLGSVSSQIVIWI